MGTEAPTIVTRPVHCAPKKAPCPTCGQAGRRTRILPPRRVRTVAYKAIASLEITGKPGSDLRQAGSDLFSSFFGRTESAQLLLVAAEVLAN